MKKQSYKFEEDYFKEYYVNALTDFTPSGLKRLRNWFRGQLSALNKYKKITNGKNKTAIEFGCALGAISNVLTDWGYSVTATDISTYAITRAKKLSPHINFLKQDIQKPMKTFKRYDLVICFDVVEHLENPEKAIKNMYNYVKDDGIVICSTPNDYEYARNTPSHINVKKPGEWEKIFKKSGFGKIIIKQMSFLPYLYRLHWRLNFSIPFGINFERICSPVFIVATKN